MAICDLVIAIPVQGLIKQFNQKILYSCMTNYDKLLNRQTTKVSNPTNRDPALHSKQTGAPKGHHELMGDSWVPLNKVTPIKWISKGKYSDCKTTLRPPSWHFRLRSRKTNFYTCFANSEPGYVNLNASQETGIQFKTLGKLNYANLYLTNKFNLGFLKVMVLQTQSVS